MNRFTLTLSLLAMLVPVAPHGQSRATGPDDATVRAWLTSRLNGRPNLGYVVGIYAGGQTRVIAVGSGGAGLPAVDGDTVFEIGSVTKLFTAAVLADMTARGEVRLEDPVQRFLPATAHVPTRGNAEIRLLDLATHTSGLPRVPSNMAPAEVLNPYADYTPALLYQFLSSYQLARDIGERYEYSNLGVGLLGHALALKSGVPYATIVAERVLRPLRMADTGIALTPELQRRAAAGHALLGSPTPNWTFDALAGCGALRSTAADLLKFVAANLEAPSDRLRTALQSMHEPRHTLGTPNGDIGLAWHIANAFGDHFVWHNGGTYGFHSFVGLNHRTGIGVVVLHNSGESIDDIGFHVLDERIPLKAR